MEHSARHDEGVAPAKRWGFVSAEGKPYFTYCPQCQRENYALAVSMGRCAFCGAGPHEPWPPLPPSDAA